MGGVLGAPAPDATVAAAAHSAARPATTRAGVHDAGGRARRGRACTTRAGVHDAGGRARRGRAGVHGAGGHGVPIR
ncbi:hypothetical protein [Nonomuraea sp. NPDC050786]|uniref:hypothetical protein n=1 Tax=Nonomuraea sp. NPDC050786 TaxID=3154840 RepID=UPI00340B8434